MGSKEEKLAELLAQGFEPDDLTWIPEGSAVSVKLHYVAGQDEAAELRKSLDTMQGGQWVIKAEAVERQIRATRGCENFSIADAMAEWARSPFLRTVHGSRGPR